MVSVDGDTSTNDMVSVMASGLAENQTITKKIMIMNCLLQALTEVCAVLSRKIAKDGEGNQIVRMCRNRSKNKRRRKNSCKIL